jgi:hypothetical protein
MSGKPSSNRGVAVASVKNILAKRIVGKEVPSSQCCCGAIKRGPTRAAAVIPGPDEYVANWQFWKVQLVTTLDGKTAGKENLNKFVPKDELERLFQQYFPSR